MKNLDESVSVERLREVADILTRPGNANREPFWNKYTEAISARLPSLQAELTVAPLKSIPNSHIATPVYANPAWPNLSWTGTDVLATADATVKTQLCARKILLTTTARQRKYLEESFGNSRYIYNKCVNALTERPEIPVNRQSLRDLTIPKYSTLDAAHPERFLLTTPYDTLQRTIDAFVANYRSGVTKLKRRQIQKFELKTLRKKSPHQW